MLLLGQIQKSKSKSMAKVNTDKGRQSQTEIIIRLHYQIRVLGLKSGYNTTRETEKQGFEFITIINNNVT